MLSEITIALTGLFCTIVSGVVTFILTKRKYNSEVDSQVIQNLSAAFSAYKKTMEDTIDLHNKKIKLLEQENEDLRQQVNQLQTQLTKILMDKYGNNNIPQPNN